MTTRNLSWKACFFDTLKRVEGSRMDEWGKEIVSMIYLVYDRSMPTDEQREHENQQRHRTSSSFWDDMRTLYRHLCCSPLFQFCLCARISIRKRAISGQWKPLRGLKWRMWRLKLKRNRFIIESSESWSWNLRLQMPNHEVPSVISLGALFVKAEVPHLVARLWATEAPDERQQSPKRTPGDE